MYGDFVATIGYIEPTARDPAGAVGNGMLCAVDADAVAALNLVDRRTQDEIMAVTHSIKADNAALAAFK